MTIPNLGVTGIIQQPGIGGIIGQGLSSLAQTLMARQQAEEERRRNEANAAYMQAQMESMAASRNRQAAQDAATAEAEAGLQQLMTPVEQTMNVPMFGAPGAPGAMGNVPITGERERTVEEVLQTLKPGAGAVTAFLEGAKPIVEQRQKTKQQKVMLAELDRLATDDRMPTAVRRDAMVHARLARIGMEPFEIVRYLQALPKQEDTDAAKSVAFYRNLFKAQLGDAPDEVVLQQGPILHSIKIGTRVDPNRPKATGKGVTPEDKKRKFDASVQRVNAEFFEKTRGLSENSVEYQRQGFAAASKIAALAIEYDQPIPTQPAPEPTPERRSMFDLRDVLNAGASAAPTQNAMVPRAGGQ